MNFNMFRNLHYVCKQLKSVRSLYEGNSLYKIWGEWGIEVEHPSI